MSEQKRSATAKLFITVKPVDSNPPVVTATATDGYADENAPIGTKVVDKDGNPIRLTVTDGDLVRMNLYIHTGFVCVCVCVCVCACVHKHACMHLHTCNCRLSCRHTQSFVLNRKI